MTEFKQGERVKVEFEALALPESSIAGDSWLLVGIPGTQLFTSVRKEHCTLIEPEIVLPEVPGTIVQVDPLNEHDERATFAYYPDPTGHEEHWSAVPTTKTEYGFMGWITTGALTVWCREYGYRVITAAEAKGVSE